jgi:glutathione S-transferase
LHRTNSMTSPTSPISLFVDAQFTSPWALATYVTLREKALPFTLHTVNLDTGEQNAAAFLARTPTNRVPAVSVGGFSLSESTAIIEYLEEVFPDAPHVLPRDREARALARQLMGWIRSDLGVIRNERSTLTVFYSPARVPLSEEAARACERLFRVVEARLAPGAPHLFADGWCIADVDVMMMLIRLVKAGDPIPARLKDYALAQWARPSVQEWVTMPRPPL